MNIDTLVVGALQANCYLVSKDNKCIIIDPGADENFIISKIKELELEPVGIILTHDHNDHIGCCDILKEMYNVEVYDYNTLFEQKHFLDPFKFKVIYTKGHTDSSITIYFYEYGVMFTGDFLFKEDIGRTDLPTGSYKDMLESIRKINEYDGDTKIYPGHGESTTLDDERKNNKYFDFD